MSYEYLKKFCSVGLIPYEFNLLTQNNFSSGEGKHVVRETNEIFGNPT